MKLEGKTRPSGLRAIEAVGKTEVVAQSEVFDPRVDLPKGDLERIKRWAEDEVSSEDKGDYLIQAAWIGWIDPAYGHAIQRNTEVIDVAWSAFLNRRSSLGRFASDLPSAETSQAPLLEKAGAYLDCAALVEAFPEVRIKLQAPEFVDDFQQVLDEAVRQSVRNFHVPVVNRIQDLKCLIQVWPEHRVQIIQALAEGGEGTQDLFIQRIEGEQSIVHAIATSAYLVLVFPELKPRLEEVMKRRMKEVRVELVSKHQRLVKEGEGVYAYNLFIKNLTILGAESAVLDTQGNLQVRLRPLPLKGKTPTLPVREHV